MNGRNVLKFTEVIQTVLQSEMNIGQALVMVQKMEGLPAKVSQAAFQMDRSLEQGRLFSNAMADCEAIHFAPDYIAFIAASEKGGSVKSTFDFLLKREKEREKRRNSLISICSYPLFVVMAAFAGGLLLALKSNDIVPDFSGTFNRDLFKSQVVLGCIKANGFLFSSALFLFLCLKKCIAQNLVFDVFSIMTFLTKGKQTLDESLKISLLSADKNVRLKEKIMKARAYLEKGEAVSAAIECIEKNCALYARFAEVNGDLKGAFVQMTSYLEDRKIKREKMCMDLVEPLTMCIVAAYIIILLKNIVMPVIFYYGG